MGWGDEEHIVSGGAYNGYHGVGHIIGVGHTIGVGYISTITYHTYNTASATPLRSSNWSPAPYQWVSLSAELLVAIVLWVSRGSLLHSLLRDVIFLGFTFKKVSEIIEIAPSAGVCWIWEGKGVVFQL